MSAFSPFGFLVDDDLAFKDDEDVCIPRASLNKYIKDILPEARIAIETRELILTCCHQFIHQLSTEANNACARANKKTINPDHILSGLDAMGLSSYVADVRAANEGAKSELKDRRMKSARYKKHDHAELQLMREEQERMFELARLGMLEENARKEQAVNENDLVQAAASTMAVLEGSGDSAASVATAANDSNNGTGPAVPTPSSPEAAGSTSATAAGAAAAAVPGSAVLLGGLRSEEDDYD